MKKVLGMYVIESDKLLKGEAALMSVDIEASMKERELVGDIIYITNLADT